MKIQHLAVAAAITLSLTACDNSNAKWTAEYSKCNSTSSEGNFTAMVSPIGVEFVATEPGCPNNLGYMKRRQTTVDINGDSYPAILRCNPSNEHIEFVPGKLVRNYTASSIEYGARALKEITSFSGAKVTLDGETAHFGKGNFAEVCLPYINVPRSVGNNVVLPHKSFLSSLFNHHSKKQPTTKQSAESEHTGYHFNGLKIEKDQPQNEPIRHAAQTQPETPPPPPLDTRQSLDTVSSSDGSIESAPAAITPEAEATALKNAQSTYLVYHPGTDISAFTWQKSPLPDKSVNGATVHVLRFTTTSPQTNVSTDVDVEINPDGSAGYATSNDHPTPVATSASVDPVNAYCMLDNGKNVNVYAANGQDYRYSYLDKNNQSELELTEGLFGVKAFHYEMQLGMGKAQYIRFNKKQYDYVLLSLDNGKREFYGIRVYKDGSLISSHACKTRLNLDVSPLTDAAHADSDKMGDFVTN